MTAIFASGLGSTPRFTPKTATFTGAAGAGAQGTVALFTVTGMVMLESFHAFNTVTLVSGGAATLALGVTGSTSGFIAATAVAQFTGTGSPPGLFWDATGTVGNIRALQANMRQIQVTQNIFITIATADVTAGAIAFAAIWRPLTVGASLVAA